MTKKIRNKISSTLKLDQWPRFHNLIKILSTFILICFGWIFFRSNNLSDALYIIKNIFTHWNFDLSFGGIGKINLVIAFFSIIMLETVQYLQFHVNLKQKLTMSPIYLRWTLYFAMIFLILFFGVFDNTMFIYFQF